MGAIDSARWTCTLSDYACRTPELPRPGEVRRGITGPVRGDVATMTPRPHVSPDGKWTAFIDNYNVAIRAAASDDAADSRLAPKKIAPSVASDTPYVTWNQ